MSQTLDLLRYSYLPPQKTTFFDLKSILYPLDTAEISYVFNENNRLYTDNYSLPKAYYLDEARSILGENEHQNDSLSTHPNLHKRRITMHGMLDSLRIPDGTGRDFITYTKETWEKWLASEKHYSLPKLYLELHSIEEAIYSAKYPSYCITDALITAKALLQLTQFRNNPAESITIESDNYQYVEGEMQRLAFTLEKLDAQEVNALTLHYTWLLAELYKSYPDSSLYCSNISLKKETVFNKLAMKALEEWVEYHSEDPNFFYDANTSIIHKELTNGKSEKTAITMGNDADFPAIVNKNYIHYALQFVNLSPNGKPLPTEIQELVVKKRKYEAFLTKEVSNIDKKEKSDDGERFGLNKVIIVNPFVAFSDLRLKDKTLYQEMEKKGVEFNQLLSQNAKSVGIDVEILSTNNLKQSDNKKFEDIIALNQWLIEQLDYGTINFEIYNKEEINKISKEYGTDYFLWTGISSVRRPKDGATLTGYLIGGIVMWPLLPYSLYYSVKPEYNTMFYAILYNIKTQKGKLVKYEFMKRELNTSVLNLHLYDLFLQLHSK
jgi:hypothetical protein